MLDDRSKMLVATVKKLYHRDAKRNIQRIFIKTHEADIASLLSSFEPGERFDLFRMEPSLEKQAGILSRLEPEAQKEMLSCLSSEEVHKLVSLMDTDDAADLLGHLSGEDAQGILSSMVKEDSEEVADLMGYPEDSAGGLMSSDFLAINQNLTVNDAIKAIQEEDEDVGVAFYIYVINDDNKLVGVISLKQLLLSKKTETLKSLMVTDVISVPIDTNQEKVAKLVEHYDFLSIPVVDGSNHLEGVITVDDIIDVIREEAEEDFLAMGQAGLGVDASTYERFKARIWWLLFAFLGGLTCFVIVYGFGLFSVGKERVSELWVAAAYIPLLLSIGATTGSQAATVAVGAIRSGKLLKSQLVPNLINEFKLSFLFSLIFGILVWVISSFLQSSSEFPMVLALSISIQIIFSMFLGNTIPFIVNRLNIDPTVASVPVFAAIADVSAMAVLFSLFYFIM